MSHVEQLKAMCLNRFFLNVIKTVLAFRLSEVVLMSGFFMVGYIFAFHQIEQLKINLLIAYACIITYIFSVYTLNSYCDYEADRENKRLSHLSSISKQAYKRLTIIAFVASVSLGYGISGTISIQVAVSFSLWCLYYYPGIQLKSTVLGGTLIHFVAAILHFHIGYLVLADWSISSVCISVYFALLLSAGHLNHEMIDYEHDKEAGIRNTTVVFGQETVNVYLQILFIVSVLYWATLYFIKLISIADCLAFILPSIGVMVLGMLFQKNRANALLFQKGYRYSFLAGGILLILQGCFEVLPSIEVCSIL